MGNLPFNVASPLLIQWLHQSAAREGLFKLGDVWMTLMFQKEVGEVKITSGCFVYYILIPSSQRLAAPPSTEHRGRLSVMAQSLCDVSTVYQVPSTVFVPRPKVRHNHVKESTIIVNAYVALGGRICCTAQAS